jgi:phage gp45-like
MSDGRALGKMLGPLSRAIQNLMSRGTVKLVNANTKMQSLQVGLMADETADKVEHFEPYGFTSNPQGGAEAIVLFPNGDRSHGIAVIVGDRRYRLKGLASGDVAVHDCRNQSVVLTETGIVINALKHTINADTEINGSLTVSDEIRGAAGIQTAGDGAFGGKSFLGHTNDGHPID